ADYFWDLFEKTTLPQLPALRKSVNYNDAHEHNLLVSGSPEKPEINGVIDFGDALYCETINELAIASAYAGMYLPDPLNAIADVVRGYHSQFTIEEKELSVLYSLISARLMLTVANAAWNKYHEPENEYLQVSEKPAWDLLKKWKKIHPEFAHYRFREVCGFKPCNKEKYFQQWLSNNHQKLIPVIESSGHKVMSLDLSVGSLVLGNNSHFNDISKFCRCIDRILEDQDASMAIGGYGERRPFYTTDAYQMERNDGASWRTVHLGVDLWARAGTDIFASLPGIVFSIQDNTGDCNYGPTIILQHEPEPGLIFYALYGHLSADSLDNVRPGQRVSAGEKIAEIGRPPINGNWPPHLHFQIILDMLGMSGDYPGVAYPDEANTWLSICPSSYSFFGIPVPGQNNDAHFLRDQRNRLLGKNLSISYENPLHIVRGYQQHLYDWQGRRYLDTVNNVAHVGHEHPEVVKVAQQQMGVLNTNTRYLHKEIILFAEELLETLPDPLSAVFFVNSGSEANELALRMVEAYTGKKEMIALESGYHGNTNRCIEVSSYKFDGKGGKGAPEITEVVPMPDRYRGLHRSEDSGARYAEYVAQAINNFKNKGRQPGGFICESILSCGGQIVLPAGYLSN
ncbi:MAG: aminotransferase class III-fold pyridoxal phosphate-dependent enzyme, partial [Saprospiraceae bacterium]|nr:aminotransferase class III-fold pyridoxal phosphate-dependent enzyme [Saprospiraceae bacterium]